MLVLMHGLNKKTAAKTTDGIANEQCKCKLEVHLKRKPACQCKSGVWCSSDGGAATAEAAVCFWAVEG